MTRQDTYRPNWNSAGDRRRKELAEFVPGTDSQFLWGYVGSNITPAVFAAGPDRIVPTTFLLSIGSLQESDFGLLYPSPLYQETIYNFSTSLSYTVPVDPKKSAFCLAVLKDGLWTQVWVDCPT